MELMSTKQQQQSAKNITPFRAQKSNKNILFKKKTLSVGAIFF